MLVCAVVAGCGSSDGDGASSTSAARPPSVAEARNIIDPYLYGLDSACKSRWLPTAQARCHRTARELKAVFARPHFALPKRGKLQYAAGGVSGGTVSIVVGNRQPQPGSGSLFYGTFTLERDSGKWLIGSFGTG